MINTTEVILSNEHVVEANKKCFKEIKSLLPNSGEGFLENYTPNEECFIDYCSKISGVKSDSLLLNLSRKSNSSVVNLEDVSVTGGYQPFIKKLPLIVVNKTGYGTLTLATPIPFLDTEELKSEIMEEFGLLGCTFILATTASFFSAHSRLLGNYQEPVVDTSSKKDRIAKNLRVLEEMGFKPSKKELGREQILSEIKDWTPKNSNAITAKDDIVSNIPCVVPNRPDSVRQKPRFKPAFFKKYSCVQVSNFDNLVTIAFHTKPSVRLIGELKGMLQNVRSTIVLSPLETINKNITAFETHGISPDKLSGELSRGQDDEASTEGRDANLETIDISALAKKSKSESATVAEFVQTILLQGIQHGATDIHISNNMEGMRVRYRIDGFLVQHPQIFPDNLTKQVLSRIKVIGNINTTYSKVAQDGKFVLEVDHNLYDMRVNITPTIGKNEEAVIRILPRLATIPHLRTLGFREREFQIVKNIIDRDHGMLVVCGPTGSGKSTTMASAISMIDMNKYAVVSGEQPVEIRIDGVEQTDIVSEDTDSEGMTFSKFIESSLRRDPDYIIIGETRDRETASQAVRAALTGHIVMTTLHTNSAPGAVSRLLDLGIPAFLLKDALGGVIAQRLVAKLCQNCARPMDPADMPDLEKLGLSHLDIKAPRFMHPVGCHACRQTGYLGRTSVVEGFVVDREVRRIIGDSSTSGSTDAIKNEMRKQQGISLFEQAFILASQGVTDIANAMVLYSED